MRLKTFFSHLRLRNGLQGLVALALIAGAFSLSSIQTQAAAVPVFSISAVDKDNLVTIQTANFPANKTFVARMGKFGTLGIGGVEVGTTFSGTGGSFTASYSIPAALKGQERLAIRLDATSGGYYSFNWFWNGNQPAAAARTPAAVQDTTGPAATASATPAVPIPTFTIENVVKGATVTIKTARFPANKTFTARMGKYGTRGVNGIVVGTTYSGAGGAFSATYSIPAELQGEARIHLRLESSTGGYYSYNWFWNSPTTAATPAPDLGPGGPVSGYSGIPTISITSVLKDNSVTLTTHNFPKNRTFSVRMGKFGTLGIGGTEVGTLASDSGGTISATYPIPDALKGQSLIAIRLDSTTGGFYSFNWFRNK